jgi:hypothetical protein
LFFCALHSRTFERQMERANPESTG